LVEVDPVEVADIIRVGLLGWVNERSEASQRKPNISPGLSLIDRSGMFKPKWVAL
jgi:hypothetical protein